MQKHSFDLIIADDHKLFRNGLNMLLSTIFPHITIREAANGTDCLELIQESRPDVVLMDIDMPELNGIEATQKALQLYPDLNIIALSMHGDEAYYFRMIEAGAKGFLLKSSDIEEVKSAIENVMANQYFFSNELLKKMVDHIRFNNDEKVKTSVFSDREQEILELICKGFSNLEISERLFISKRTVDKHRANLLEKAEARNTAQLIMNAIKHNWINI
ncbi:MAG: response regulator transcription factor [Bacteroidales bacterium]|jgi:DNA-binding NarL/FixJ family response regulator|nr:response regulator transcription factor [Bacteroidales bacterium]MDD4085806.1 response regulator transcription factor [Bacteroidales bacterium]MDY0084941.1 response regulator transcription factor [Bacteroidales bacterium]